MERTLRVLQEKMNQPDGNHSVYPKPLISIVKIFWVLPFFLVSACSTVFNRVSVGALPASVILVTAGSPKDCKAKITHLEVYERTSRMPVDGIPNIPVETYINDTDSGTHFGTVNTFRLQAGKYYIYPVTANALDKPMQTPTFTFEVKPGETVYVGELFMTSSCRLTKRFIVNDEYDRDTKRATKENPSIPSGAPVKRLLQTKVP